LKRLRSKIIKGDVKMAEIINVCNEYLPSVRLIGKRYTSADGADGGFGHKWGEWFQNNWFASLESLDQVPDMENGYIGFMRGCPDFEYWIGMFLPPETPAPEGYDYIDLDKCNVGVCWIKGNDDDGSIYAMHEKCFEALKEKGIVNRASDCATCTTKGCFSFERYNCPRFTEKDAQGNVILDYGIRLP